MSFLTCTMPIQSPLCGPKARTKSWPASPASASARLIPRPRNLWHEPMLQDTRSPNLNSYAERWVRSVKEECLSRLILFGASSLRRALQQYIVHYHEERNHQGKDNRILFPSQTEARRNRGAVRCRERLGGLLKYYEREAA